jgi:hypothetical protein
MRPIEAVCFLCHEPVEPGIATLVNPVEVIPDMHDDGDVLNDAPNAVDSINTTLAVVPVRNESPRGVVHTHCIESAIYSFSSLHGRPRRKDVDAKFIKDPHA